MQQHAVVGGHRRVVVVEKLPDGLGRVEHGGRVSVADAPQGGHDQRGGRRGKPPPSEREGEPRDIAQPELSVEQPLVQRRGAPPAGTAAGLSCASIKSAASFSRRSCRWSRRSSRPSPSDSPNE